MGDLKGFLKIKRKEAKYRLICQRLKDYDEVCILPGSLHTKEQAARCMDCGTPFCHWGCPIGNYIPEWNDLAFRGRWQEAHRLLAATNDFAEITGRICPAICEYACVLGINDEAVTIRENELVIVERAFKNKLIKPSSMLRRSGKKVAVIGSGPAGLACAVRLNRAGHRVVVFERDDKIGGILRYGIPDFKLKKSILERRINLWRREGIEFEPGVNVGFGLSVRALKKDFDSICLAAGSRLPRDLDIPGRELPGVHFAMDYLVQSNKIICGRSIPAGERIDARGKKVLVIGGGDTGADCVGVANRQKAGSVTQIEILPKPAHSRTAQMPWPGYPKILKITSSHQEGVKRIWGVETKKFLGQEGYLHQALCYKGGKEFKLRADLAILALGFLGPDKKGLISELDLVLDARGNVYTDTNFMTSSPGIFCAGDMRRGQSLVVWAISDGYGAASGIDAYLKHSR
jgi:glutamate synthase (NADPH/NADH) small chain